MSNLFAWASQSENGSINGKVGDQTGREVKIGTYYYFGQTKCIRCTNISKRRIAGKVAKLFAEDNCVGYSQNDARNNNGLFKACKAYNWDYEKIKNAVKNKTFPKCNTDCSGLITVCYNVAYGSEIIPACTTTSTMHHYLCDNYPKRFKEIPISKMLKSAKKGDMPYVPGKHVIINV